MNEIGFGTKESDRTEKFLKTPYLFGISIDCLGCLGWYKNAEIVSACDPHC